ncbi:MAG TPA: lysozyme inhibitor LprI family protein [Luteibacter sp.]|uniref:lysozyme inhibitor LprI family protein n=1 Tax=Luteibacter sp. TaxID=1886636 RepID=UPI002B560C4D|nr:lysozyme inhibitor LprI family protein [Luteibacter sp.]HVI55840.1 lysozyme inhibitor LprI family protein [Luteibacter sp.]
MFKNLRVASAALLLAAPLMAHAASFDCAKAGTPSEKAVCASPKVSALDGKLGDAFRTALKNHPDKADALKLDQRHWLASRDDTAWTYISGGLGKELVDLMAGQYERRIAFLAGLDAGKPKAPLAVVSDALPKLPSGSRDILNDLKAQGAPIVLAKEVEMKDISALPYQPDAALKKALAGLDDNLTDRVLAGSPFSSAYSMGGTAHCLSEAPYRIDGKKAVAIDGPPVWGDDCMTNHLVAKLGDDYAAVNVDTGDADQQSIEASRWAGKGFGPAEDLILRFDHALKLDGAACAPKQSPCDEFGTVAMTYVAKYDRNPQGGTLDRALKGSEKTAYDAAVARAKAPGGIAAKGDAPTLPDFGSDNLAAGSMTGYDVEATLFPLTFRGETLVGYIGHGHVGWRANDDWMVSAWRLKDGKLEPVASAYVNVVRGSLLLSAPVPAPPPESH